MFYHFENFDNKIDKKSIDECWEWTGTKSLGYGVLTINYRTITAEGLKILVSLIGKSPKNLMFREV